MKHKEQFDLFQPGDKLQSTLWMRAPIATPVSLPAIYWDFPCAMNEDFSMTVNMDSQEVIGWTAAWGADGIYYRPGQDGAPTREFPTDSDSL